MRPALLLLGLVAAATLLPAAAAQTHDLPDPCRLLDPCDPLPPIELPDPRPLLCRYLVCTQQEPVPWCRVYEVPGLRVVCLGV